MTLDLTGCTLVGPALTTAFLADGLPPVPEADHAWQRLRRTLAIGEIRAGESADRVLRSVVLPIATALGYGTPVRQKNLPTREGEEDGGWLATSAAATLRMWPVTSAANLDALHRHNPLRTAFRVLFAQKEPIGLLTDGASVFILVSDAARSDTCLCLSLAGWRDNDRAPDTWQLLWTLLAAARRPNLPKLLESARLYQTRITSALRIQAGEAITGFINALPDRTGLSAADLWHDALILIHRLLFVLKLEASGPQGEGFSFTATNLWRNALSPNRALGALVRRHLDHGVDTGHMLEDGLRAVFAILRDGLRCRELSIAALATTVGGSLFGTALMPHLDSLRWGDRAVALLLDRLLWLPGRIRSRVHYGSLGVEDLGGVYEALLELEPAIEDDRFVLRPGLRRKTSGTYYTPHEFVRFLVCQTLDPAIEARSTPTDPNPAALLAIRVVDPSCGSGHFLVEACRHLAEALLNASHQADRLGLHSRVAELPDSGALLPYLPSRGDNEAKALAVCRRFIAVHCLYGCDRNPLAVELAKLSLWLESWAEGLPLTFLDHRLVCGDALTGPFGQSLTTLPVTGGPIDPLLAHDVETAITRRLSMARDLASILNTSIGRDLPDISTKLAAKSRFDLLLAPLRQLAAAWTAAAMMGTRDADDRWLAQARTTLATASLDPYTPIAAIRRSDVIDAAGSVPSTDIESDALPWDLAFPEVFPGGFTAVLGNPPWDVLQPNRGDFLATQVPHSSHDKRKRAGGSESAMLLTQPAVAARYAAYREGFARMKRIAPKLYPLQRAATANLDLFRLFAERALQLCAPDGAIGLLLPSAFHANERTAGLRQQYLAATRIDICLSFENRRQVFDIDSRIKFDVIVARRPGPTAQLRCGFYLQKIADADDKTRIMIYDRAFLNAAGGPALTFPELRCSEDQEIAKGLFANPDRLRPWCAERGIRLGRDLHMTEDSALFLPPMTGDLILHEGKTFHQFTMQHNTPPRFSVRAAELRPAIAQAAGYTRLAFRDIARSNDERTMIACLAPPGSVFSHTATVEKTPWGRNPQDAALLCALFNSFPFDWLIRQKAATHLSLYLLNDLPIPRFSQDQERFLAAAASSGLPASGLRARMDAIVARAYGLDCTSYAHLLNGFSHKSWTDAPTLCLAAFEKIPEVLSCAA